MLFNIMTKIAHGFLFQDPQGIQEIKRTMEAFVDDTDVAVNDSITQYTQPEKSHKYCKQTHSTGKNCYLHPVGN
jgi:hypothetical protein